MAKNEKTKSRSGRIPLPFLAACAVLVVLSWMLQYVFFPAGLSLVNDPEKRADTVSEIAPLTDVVISEIMTSNKRAVTDETGSRPDWVELYNKGKTDADLSGWMLADSLSAGKAFVFPEGTVLPAGACAVIYCARYYDAQPGGPYHAPFRLSAQGDALLLYDANGSVMESVNIPALGADQVYARANSTGAFAVSSDCTPGMPNTPENIASRKNLAAAGPMANPPAVISELMADNRKTLTDASGNAPDWIEIQNVSNGELNLVGWALSDDPEDPGKFRFPQRILNPGEVLLVYASGQSVGAAGELHAPFRLNAEGETVTLYAPDGQIADRVSFELLKPDQALTRTGNGTANEPATPGR